MSDSDLKNYVRVLDRWKRFIVGIVGTVAVASLVISFFLPKWYAARSSLIPPQQSEIGGILASLVQGVSVPGIPSLAPASGESQLFLAILDSRTVREELIRKHDLMRVYKARTMDDALKALGTLARASLTDRGVVEVVVEDRDPKRAADIANDWVAALDQFNKTSRMTAGRRNREFVEARLMDTRASLTAAENGLAEYQQLHPNAPMSSELSAAVESGASLIARRMALQVRLNMARGIYRDGTPQVAQLQSELAALDSQVGLLPPLAMEFARRLRDLKVQEQVYALLMAQLEEARIQENRDMPTLEILDRASPPERRVRPIRWLFCTSLTLAALVLSVGTAFVVEFGRRVRSAARA
jgi:uncharacterized protein involved in exopolysaccharide biosynthesis